MDQIKFKTKSQYGIYLRETLSQMLKNDKFNIFLHCVTNAYPHSFKPMTEKDDVLYKVNAILTTGLNLEGNKECCPYGSINGVARFMGEANNVNIEDIINYSFVNHSRYINTIILAIPKYIQLPNGKKEFSSYQGHMDEFSPFTKACLLDISKERHLPTAFTLGYQLLDRETNVISFWQNNQHFSQIPQAEQDTIMQKFANKIVSVVNDCKANHQAKSIEDVFSIMTRKHYDLLEDYFNDI